MSDIISEPPYMKIFPDEKLRTRGKNVECNVTQSVYYTDPCSYHFTQV